MQGGYQGREAGLQGSLRHRPQTGLGGRNQTSATCSQSTHDITSPHREKLERVEGIEPSHLAWQASRLPLHHTRRLVEMERIELSIPACKTGVFPLALHPRDWK